MIDTRAKLLEAVAFEVYLRDVATFQELTDWPTDDQVNDPQYYFQGDSAAVLKELYISDVRAIVEDTLRFIAESNSFWDIYRRES